MLYKLKTINLITIFSLITIGWGCIDGVEVDINGTCYNIQSTTSISLSYSSWTEIPPEIGELVNLETFALHKADELTGTIPPEIGNLVNLETLVIDGYSSVENNGIGNSLSGNIPDEIGNLVNLETLKIRYSNIEGSIPSSIENLTALTMLDLNRNNLSGSIPQEIWDLPNLLEIDLGYNQLTGSLPNAIANASNFLEIELHSNQLSGSMPAGFGQLVELNRLDLRYNQLSGELPDEFCGIGSNNVYDGSGSDYLRFFLAQNDFSGDAPSCICDMDYLYFTSYNAHSGGGSNAFGYNKFCPPYLSCAVGYYSSAGNNISEINDLSYYFTMGYPIGQYQDVSECPLDDCGVAGGINEPDTGTCDCFATPNGDADYDNCGVCREPGDPDYDSTCVGWNGRYFDIETTTSINCYGDNLLYNTEIPEDIGELVNLQYIFCENRDLTGIIPSSIGNLTHLIRLELQNNQLSETIPAELENLSNLEYLILYNNQLTGTIPTMLGNLTNLNYLGLSNNQLSGEIPSELGNLANLEYLYLYDNQLSEEIPAELGNLSNLQRLYLYDNQLSGEIPSDLGNLNLNIFQLQNNQLSGIIPEEICNAGAVPDVSNNNLCPPYPDCISQANIDSQDTSECIQCSDSLGDLNYDGIVNVVDIISMVNCIVSNNRCDICYDLTGDSIINIVDIITLINIILDNNRSPNF